MHPAARAEAALRERVLDGEHPCLGARAALRQGTYRMNLYDALGDGHSARSLWGDLVLFTQERGARSGRFTTFIAAFRGPLDLDEAGFEALLWRQLQLVHDIDATEYAWDPTVSDDPDDPGFSFSVGGCAFFVVGLHANSSRMARRFALPTLCFNPHRQFEDLRSAGLYVRFRDRIRRRDRAQQGTLNPTVQDHGMASEAAQYSGRETPPGWRCPLRVHHLVA